MKDLSVNIQCPGCHRQAPIKVREMIPGGTRDCPNCGAKFRFAGDDGRKIQKALDDLEKEVKRLSTTINLRI